MCAINGIAGNGTDAEKFVGAMNSATVHRGPDGTRVLLLSGVVLGFNRLAIIDLNERSMQPMQTPDGRYTLIFNGEIYNFKELRGQLADSYDFKTESDTEVILAAYARWGREAFAKLNGMFALAIFDREISELVLARDSSGIKPLYYHEREGTLAFSSELPALFEAGVPRKLDVESLGHYLRLKYVPGPHTMVEGIRKLLPGHVLVWKESRSRVEPFQASQQLSHDYKGNYANAVRTVRETVEGAIKRQLVADVPVGLYLSGGVDSSVILAAASKVHPAINTFSIGFDLSDHEQRDKFNADSVLARKTAAHFGATHHEFLLSSGDVLDAFPNMIRHMSEPVGNATALAQLYLAHRTREHATVVLTGDGGDELFGGYERYRLALLAKRYGRFVPGFIPIRNLHQKGIDRFVQLMFEKDAEITRVLGRDFQLPDTSLLFAEGFSGGDIADELMVTDERTWLVDEALLRGDNMSMASSLEARVPFLDEEVKALAHMLPRAWKVNGGRTKRILKDAFAGVLPHELLHQPKRGWFSPGAKWLRRDDFVTFADDVFSGSYAPGVSKLFDMSGIRALWQEHREGRAYHYTLLWSLLVFFAWAREYTITV